MYSSFTCLWSVPIRLQNRRSPEERGALFTTVPLAHNVWHVVKTNICQMNEWIFSVDLESLPVSLLTTARHLLSPQEVYDNCAGDTQKLGLTEDSAFSRRRGLALNSDTAHPL